MHSDAAGEDLDPVPIGSCLSGLEDEQQFDAWVAMHRLGMLDGHEIVYDLSLGGFRLEASNKGAEAGESEL